MLCMLVRTQSITLSLCALNLALVYEGNSEMHKMIANVTTVKPTIQCYGMLLMFIHYTMNLLHLVPDH